MADSRFQKNTATPRAKNKAMTNTMNRRQMLRTTSTLAAAALGISRNAWAAPRAVVKETTVITRQPKFYHGWPTIARRRNGELLVVCSGGREAHVCPFGRVELIRSGDDGRTWSDARVLLDGPIDERDAGVLETDKGTLLVTTFTSLAYQRLFEQPERTKSWPKGRLERWHEQHNKLTEPQRQAALGEWMLRSTDGGKTWSEPYATGVNSPHGPIQLSDGRQLYAGKELWRGELRIGVSQSTDDGRTWQWLARIPTRPGDTDDQYHELHAVEASDGRLIAQIRNHNTRNAAETLQCHSTDGGKSWSVPRSIGVWGLPSHLLRLDDGRLLMTYGYRRKPRGNRARVSEDQGRTWSEAVILSDDGVGDLGYPSTVQLADGSLLSVWYERMKDAPMAVLRQARWSLDG